MFRILAIFSSPSARFWRLLQGLSMLSPRLPRTCDLSLWPFSFSCRLSLLQLVKLSFVCQLHLVTRNLRKLNIFFWQPSLLTHFLFGIMELWVYYLSFLVLDFGILSVTLIDVRMSWTTCQKVILCWRSDKYGSYINVILITKERPCC